jgi:Bacterial regulatory helix-turn-helix protein, lysR family
MKQNFTVRQGALDGVETFLVVAQRRSFRRTAAKLGGTPSAISQEVRALEARVGAALFIRTTRGVMSAFGPKQTSLIAPHMSANEQSGHCSLPRLAPSRVLL